MSSRAAAQLSPRETTLLQSHIRQWLEEDVGSGDVTTLATIPRSQQCHARFLAKSNGVVSGLKIIEQVFAAVDPTLQVKWTAQDGDYVRTGTYFGTVSGSSHSVVTAERLALNIMQRMSGIATATHTMVSAVTSAGHRTRILDTRKTAPGLRSLDKLAVLHGGGVNHRIGLYDMVMIKDNHVSAAGGIIQAVEMVKTYLKKHNRDNIKIEVEARTLEEVRALVEYAHRHPHDHHIDRVLLDNMVKKISSGYDVSLLKSAVQLINGKFETEGSGNVTLESVAIIASTGVDFVSVGSLTHSVMALDISLKITEVQPSKL